MSWRVRTVTTGMRQDATPNPGSPSGKDFLDLLFEFKSHGTSTCTASAEQTFSNGDRQLLSADIARLLSVTEIRHDNSSFPTTCDSLDSVTPSHGDGVVCSVCPSSEATASQGQLLQTSIAINVTHKTIDEEPPLSNDIKDAETQSSATATVSSEDDAATIEERYKLLQSDIETVCRYFNVKYSQPMLHIAQNLALKVQRAHGSFDVTDRLDTVQYDGLSGIDTRSLELTIRESPNPHIVKDHRSKLATIHSLPRSASDNVLQRNRKEVPLSNSFGYANDTSGDVRLRRNRSCSLASFHNYRNLSFLHIGQHSAASAKHEWQEDTISSSFVHPHKPRRSANSISVNRTELDVTVSYIPVIRQFLEVCAPCLLNPDLLRITANLFRQLCAFHLPQQTIELESHLGSYWAVSLLETVACARFAQARSWNIFWKCILEVSATLGDFSVSAVCSTFIHILISFFSDASAAKSESLSKTVDGRDAAANNPQNKNLLEIICAVDVLWDDWDWRRVIAEMHRYVRETPKEWFQRLKNAFATAQALGCRKSQNGDSLIEPISIELLTIMNLSKAWTSEQILSENVDSIALVLILGSGTAQDKELHAKLKPIRNLVLQLFNGGPDAQLFIVDALTERFEAVSRAVSQPSDVSVEAPTSKYLPLTKLYQEVNNLRRFRMTVLIAGDIQEGISPDALPHPAEVTNTTIITSICQQKSEASVASGHQSTQWLNFLPGDVLNTEMLKLNGTRGKKGEIHWLNHGTVRDPPLRIFKRTKIPLHREMPGSHTSVFQRAAGLWKNADYREFMGCAAASQVREDDALAEPHMQGDVFLEPEPDFASPTTVAESASTSADNLNEAPQNQTTLVQDRCLANQNYDATCGGISQSPASCATIPGENEAVTGENEAVTDEKSSENFDHSNLFSAVVRDVFQRLCSLGVPRIVCCPELDAYVQNLLYSGVTTHCDVHKEGIIEQMAKSGGIDATSNKAERPRKFSTFGEYAGTIPQRDVATEPESFQADCDGSEDKKDLSTSDKIDLSLERARQRSYAVARRRAPYALEIKSEIRKQTRCLQRDGFFKKIPKRNSTSLEAQPLRDEELPSDVTAVMIGFPSSIISTTMRTFRRRSASSSEAVADSRADWSKISATEFSTCAVDPKSGGVCQALSMEGIANKDSSISSEKSRTNGTRDVGFFRNGRSPFGFVRVVDQRRNDLEHPP